MPTNLKQRVVAKTSDFIISLNGQPSGTVFTNAGATGPVTFTLPPPKAAYLGVSYLFHVVAAQTLTVAPTSPDQLIHAGTDTVASIAGAELGKKFAAICLRRGDGTHRWHANTTA